MMRMPSAATARMLSIQASIERARPPSRRMSSGTGMLSTTVHVSGTRPAGAFSISALRSATALRGHASPGAY